MKKLLTILSFLTFMNSAFAAETIGEKVDAKANDAKRSIKSTINKGEEKVCDKTDKNCLPTKANNKAGEAKDYMKDKTKQGKNILDNENEKTN